MPSWKFYLMTLLTTQIFDPTYNVDIVLLRWRLPSTTTTILWLYLCDVDWSTEIPFLQTWSRKPLDWVSLAFLSFIYQFNVIKCLFKKLSTHQQNANKHNSKWISFHLFRCLHVEHHMTFEREKELFSTGLQSLPTHMKAFMPWVTSGVWRGNPILCRLSPGASIFSRNLIALRRRLDMSGTFPFFSLTERVHLHRVSIHFTSYEMSSPRRVSYVVRAWVHCCHSHAVLFNNLDWVLFFSNEKRARAPR